MLIVSQNMTNYDVTLPDDTIFRINLAWINDLETLKTILEKHDNHKINTRYLNIQFVPLSFLIFSSALMP